MNLNMLKPALPALILPFLALSAPAQTETGIAHPEQLNDPIQTEHYVKPSRAAAAVQAPAPAYQDSYPATGVASPATLLPRDPASASIVGAAPAPIRYAPYTPPNTAQVPTLAARPNVDPADSDIVLEVPTRPHELNRGTLLHARLREALNTQTTAEGSIFTAELIADAGHGGEVMLPTGSLIRGRVTSVHSGKRITGGAAMHLQPETISLPDGTLYRLDAQVTDLDSTQDLRVNDEGTVVLRSNPKAAVAVIGGVTATAAVTGALIGGGVGAAVGAVAGAGIATAVYLKREIQERLPEGTDLIFALNQPLLVTPR